MSTISTSAERLAAQDQAEYRRRIRAWIMYDWANSAFATTILAAVLPVYYSAVAGAHLPSPATATGYWSTTLSISVLIVAAFSPILGTISDIKRGKKRFLTIFVTIGIIGTGLLVLVNTGDWLLASVLFVIGRIGFGGANIFYDALLPHVAREEDRDRVSAQGYAIGYLGGGLLLALNVAMIQFLPVDNWGVRLSLLSVAVWWGLFSIPLLRRVPEPPAASRELAPGESLLQVSFGRVIQTLREIRQYRQLFRYLVAFIIYNDAIGVIITIAAIYGAELGFGQFELILAILLVQFVGIPFSLVFGNLSGPGGRRQSMYTAFIFFNIVMLPVVGPAGRFLLPQDITGRPSPPFVSTENGAGEGVYAVTDDAVVLEGNWDFETVSADLIDLNEDQTYAFSMQEGAIVRLPFNGQPVEVTYSTGPDRGIWAVFIDEQPLLDVNNEPVSIDGYSPTVRYEITREFVADSEGEHTLTLFNSSERNPESTGTTISVSQFEVLPPLRTSNLVAVLGLLLGLQLIGLLFAFLAGPPLFSGIAASLDTKRSIMVALVAYTLIATWGFFLNSVIEFWFLAWMVAVVQGGSQALSRSLYASMSPNAMSGEFFGLFSIMSKFASVLSPLVFTLAVLLFDSSRPGILSLIVFFLVGMYLLLRVDVAEGKRVARAKDEALLSGQVDGV
jgi:UMF1 family MFS transporter